MKWGTGGWQVDLTSGVQTSLRCLWSNSANKTRDAASRFKCKKTIIQGGDRRNKQSERPSVTPRKTVLALVRTKTEQKRKIKGGRINSFSLVVSERALATVSNEV